MSACYQSSANASQAKGATQTASSQNPKLLQREQQNDIGGQARGTAALCDVLTCHREHCTYSLFKTTQQLVILQKYV